MNFKKYISWLFFLMLICFLYFFYSRLRQQIGGMNKSSFATDSDQILIDLESSYVSKKTNKNQPDSSAVKSKPPKPFVQSNSSQNVDYIETSESSRLTCVSGGAYPHLFKESEKKIFYTAEEKFEFFTDIGIEYLNGIIFDYAPAVDIDSKEAEKYINDVDGNNILSSRYKEDIKSKSLASMSIRWINEYVGHGVFAEEDLTEGAFIGIYGGLVQKRALIKERDYAWAYPIRSLGGSRLILDAGKKGNELRFLNDGTSPNCIMKNIIGPDGLWYVCYLALKDIQKGDQLLISYGLSYWDTRKYNYQELLDSK